MTSYFKDNLKLLRRKAGLNQDQFAELFNLSRAQISSYELKGAQPRLETLMQVAKYFEISVEILLSQNLAAHPNLIEERLQTNTVPKIWDKEVVLRDKELSHKVSFLETQIEHLSKIIDSQKQLLELSSHLNQTAPKKQEVKLSLHDDNGKFIEWDTINIPNENYIAIGSGVHDRLLTSAKDMKFEWEMIFKNSLETIDFTKNKVILNRSFGSSIFPKHYHAEVERIHVVKGHLKELISKIEYKTGDIIKFDSFQPHAIECFEESFLIVALEII